MRRDGAGTRRVMTNRNEEERDDVDKNNTTGINSVKSQPKPYPTLNPNRSAASLLMLHA